MEKMLTLILTDQRLRTITLRPADSEAQHQATVQATFDSYRQASLSANQRRRADYYALPKLHRELLGDYSALLREVSCVNSSNPTFLGADVSRAGVHP